MMQHSRQHALPHTHTQHPRCAPHPHTPKSHHPHPPSPAPRQSSNAAPSPTQTASTATLTAFPSPSHPLSPPSTSSPSFLVTRGNRRPAYEAVLQDARAKQTFDQAKAKFEAFLKENPWQCKAWVSYAMLEKRRHESYEDQHRACRAILQRGLQLNPDSSCIIQAFGLLELQRNNPLAALMLLERCVKLDPKLQPVMNWTQVTLARQAVQDRLQRRKAEVAARQVQQPNGMNIVQ